MRQFDYDQHAEDFLREFNLALKVVLKGEGCLSWDHKDGCKHGDHYRVTVKDKTHKQSLSFDFCWGSIKDMGEQKAPSAYDILACLSSEVSYSTDPGEVAGEFGRDMMPSQAITVARFARKLQNFFTVEQQEALAGIRFNEEQLDDWEHMSSSVFWRFYAEQGQAQSGSEPNQN